MVSVVELGWEVGDCSGVGYGRLGGEKEREGAVTITQNRIFAVEGEMQCDDDCGVRTHALADWRLKQAP